MSGVVDEHGQQWERCNKCGGWEKFEFLGYEPPTEEFKYGRDLCRKCTPAPKEANHA